MKERPFLDSDAKSTAEYKEISLKKTLESLKTTTNGLSGAEAAKRLALFGHNEITEKKKNPFLEFLLRYWSPMPWLLEPPHPALQERHGKHCCGRAAVW